MITITHTPADGTILEGTTRGDGAADRETVFPATVAVSGHISNGCCVT